MESEQFGPYVLVRRLAIGGMGELFLAQRTGIAGFSKQGVVKRIRPELACDAEFVDMFLNEGRVAALIDHPNVVHIYELGQVDGTYFMSMEYVPGKDLATVLRSIEGPLELPSALHIMNSVCEGISFAHEATGPDGQPLGLVHRDLNPRNVLVGYAGTVKIADFGIAKVQQQHYKQTKAGVLKGNFGYLSPEQASGAAVDRRSDIYTLGLLLFEMTTGERALPGRTDTELLYAAARGMARRPSNLTPSYPPGLERIYLKTTSKRAEDRYQTAKALHDDLLAFQMEERLTVTSGKLADWMQQIYSAEWAEERGARSGSDSQPRRPPSTAGDWVEAPRPLAGPSGAPASGPVRDLPRPALDAIFTEELPAPDGGRGIVTSVMDEQELNRSLSSPARSDGPAPRADSPSTKTLSRGLEYQPTEGDLPPRPAETGPGSRRMRIPLASQRTETDTEVAEEMGDLASGEAADARTGQPSTGEEEDEPAFLETQRYDSGGLILTMPEDPEICSLTDSGSHEVPVGHMASRASGWRRSILLAALALAVMSGVGVATYVILRHGRRPPVRPAGADARSSPGMTDSGPLDVWPLDARPPYARPPDVRPDQSARDTGGSTATHAPTGRLDLSSVQPVTVFWRGRQLGDTPLNTDLPSGRQRLTLRNPSLGIVVYRTVSIRAGGRTSLLVDLGKGQLAVRVRPWADVIINGDRRGTTPLQPLDLYEGEYKVELVNPGLGKTHTVRVTIRPDETTSLVHVF